jgi:hypothetical protein
MEAIATDQQPKSGLLVVNATVEILPVTYDSAECKGAEVEVLLDLTLK